MNKAISLGAFAFACLAAPLAAFAQTGAPAHDPAKPAYMTAADLAVRVGKVPESGFTTFDAPTSQGQRLMMIRREKDGEVEVHETVDDQFIVVEGRATVRAGGAATGQRSTGPGEWRGGTLTGGDSFTLEAGDILWVPAGMPHQVIVPAGGVFRYFTVKAPGRRP